MDYFDCLSDSERTAKVEQYRHLMKTFDAFSHNKYQVVVLFSSILSHNSYQAFLSETDQRYGRLFLS